MTEEEYKAFINSQLEKVETKLRNEGFFDKTHSKILRSIMLKKIAKYAVVAVALILLIYFLM